MPNFEYHSDAEPVDDRAQRPGRAPAAPGKRTKTDRMSPGGKPDWRGYVLDGTVCDMNPTATDCHYTETQRARLISTVLTTAVESAMANNRDAITELWVIIKTLPGFNSWGFFAEVMFGGLANPLVGAVVRGITAAGGRVAAHLAEAGRDVAALRAAKIGAAISDHVEEVKGVVLQVSKGIRTAAKNAAHGRPGNEAQSAFLELNREQVKPLTDGIILGVKDLSDDALDAMVEAYLDTHAHAVAAYKADYRELLSRYEANYMPQVGVESSFIHGDVRWITDRGGTRKRMALFRSHGLDKPPADGVSPVEPEFTRWIDKDFAQLAADLYQQRTGREPDVYSLDDFSTVRGKGWLESLFIDAMHDMTPTGASENHDAH